LIRSSAGAHCPRGRDTAPHLIALVSPGRCPTPRPPPDIQHDQLFPSWGAQQERAAFGDVAAQRTGLAEFTPLQFAAERTTGLLESAPPWSGSGSNRSKV
jgi:hypothetical protein